jgi:spore coat protein U-like protein
MKSKLFLVLAITLAFAGFAAAIDSVTDNLNVLATIPTGNCSIISVTSVDFGNLNGNVQFEQTPGMITLNCQNGLHFWIALDAGQHYSSPARQMSGPSANLVTYLLFKDANHNVEWGDSDVPVPTYPQGSSLQGDGTGSNVGFPVYGGVVGSSETGDLPGAYSDGVVVTVYF